MNVRLNNGLNEWMCFITWWVNHVNDMNLNALGYQPQLHPICIVDLSPFYQEYREIDLNQQLQMEGGFGSSPFFLCLPHGFLGRFWWLVFQIGQTTNNNQWNDNQKRECVCVNDTIFRRMYKGGLVGQVVEIEDRWY